MSETKPPRCRHDIGWLSVGQVAVYIWNEYGRSNVRVSDAVWFRRAKVVMKCNNSECTAHRNVYFDRTGKLVTIGRIRWFA